MVILLLAAGCVAALTSVNAAGWGAAAAIMAMMPMAGAGAIDGGCGKPFGLRPLIVMPMPTEKFVKTRN